NVPHRLSLFLETYFKPVASSILSGSAWLHILLCVASLQGRGWCNALVWQSGSSEYVIPSHHYIRWQQKRVIPLNISRLNAKNGRYLPK
ncbi:MAG TPA: hypothetical protein V6C81_20910, partial [Planktothrix sp.]